MADNPWDIRKPSDKGDVKPDTIFTSVGYALTEWEQVENECARLFAVFVSAQQRRTYEAPALRAFGCVISSRTRCDMLRMAAAAYFVKRPKKKRFHGDQFDKLMKAYVGYGDRRNEIAHGRVQNVLLTERRSKRGHRLPALGFYLLPSFYNPKKFKGHTFTYRYTATDVLYYAQEFTKLHLRISGIRELMSRGWMPRVRRS
jgi:hypothetical protein